MPMQEKARTAPIVRPATVGDCATIAEIYAHYVATSVATFDTDALDVDGWAAKLAAITDADRPFLVAVDGEQVVGYAYLGGYNPKAAYRQTCEDTIYVAPGLEQRGVGSALMAALLDAAAATDVREVVALIALPGDGSIALHHRHGFVDVGVLAQVGFKLGRWIDVAILQRSIGQ